MACTVLQTKGSYAMLHCTCRYNSAELIYSHSDNIASFPGLLLGRRLYSNNKHR